MTTSDQPEAPRLRDGADSPSARHTATALVGLWLAAFAADGCAVRLPAGGADDGDAIPCQAAMECPQPDNPCLLAYCMELQCVHVPSPAGQLPEEAQQPGDCQQQYCDGNGQMVAYPASFDPPDDDDNPCTEELCEGTQPKHTPTQAGTACGEEGLCNGKGKCGVCLPEAKECQGHGVRTCTPAGQWTKTAPCSSTEPVCSTGRCVALADVALGSAHGCARFQDGSVRCWGSTAGGRLGLGGPAAARAPGWGSGFQGVAIGARHGCGLDAAGAVWCWGANDFGQLGNGGYESSAGPSRAGAAKATAVAVGESHSCALSADGAVHCWGRNDRGQLGSGKAPRETLPDTPAPRDGGSPQPRPQPIANLAAVTELALPGPLTCVRRGATPPRCWGTLRFALPEAPDDPAALKKLEKATRAQPSRVAELPPSRQVAVGAQFACALSRDGLVHCWGANDQGQLGDGSRNARHKPGAVRGLTGVASLAAGARFACAKLQAGSVQCWGANDHGQLGTGKAGPAVQPTPVAGLSGVRTLLAGESFACALQNAGPLVCWGAGGAGQLGNGATADAPRPTPVTW